MKTNEEKKKILLIEKGLLTKACFSFLGDKGFQITPLNLNNPQRYRYKRLKDKIKNIFARNILRKKNYLQTLDFQYHDDFHQKKLKKFFENRSLYFDAIIIVRPDIYSPRFMKLLRKYSKAKIVGYMWDGISQAKYENLSSVSPYYHQIFCFDPKSIEKYPDLKLKFCTNFYYPNDFYSLSLHKQNCIGYVGGIANNRDELILKLIQALQEIEDYKFNIRLLVNKERKNTTDITYIREYLPYEEHLKTMAESVLSFDLSPGYHQGVSFRIFEALYFRTKIISTNTSLRDYDFFHPNNILLVENQNDIKKIKDFLPLPFEEISPKIMEKYRADTWLKTLLETP